MENLKIEQLPVSALKPYERNARKHQGADVEAIVRSINEFGFNDPIGIWGEDNLIVEGHGRLLAAQQLKMETVPCIRLDHLTDEQRRAYALAHNKTAELSEWDALLLPEELQAIQNIDMSEFGFDIDLEEVYSDEAEKEDVNPTENLPDSRIYVFAVSAFGTNSECFVEAKLSQEEADRFLERMKEVQASDVAEKLREALDAV